MIERRKMIRCSKYGFALELVNLLGEKLESVYWIVYSTASLVERTIGSKQCYRLGGHDVGKLYF